MKRSITWHCEDVFKPILVTFVDIGTAFAVIITAKANAESHGRCGEYTSGVSQCFCDLNLIVHRLKRLASGLISSDFP